MPQDVRTEHFHWDGRVYDISAILQDIESKAITPVCIEWPAEAVKAYFDEFLNTSKSAVRPPLHVNVAYAEKLGNDRLSVPIILVHIEDQGVVAYDEPDDKPHHIVADGNHRITCAALLGKGLLAYMLTRQESRKYEVAVL